MARLRIAAVTPETWPDFERLFSARGAPHHCWCTAYRFRDLARLDSTQKKSLMEGAVDAGPVGVLAYDGDEPVGWCSIAPRESYEKLERSRTMPRVSNARTWTVLCFFVPRTRRGQRVPSALLEGGMRYALEQGAEEIEGYPHDTAGTSATHRGTSKVFKAAGFKRAGNRWVYPATK